ncbi:MAG: putative sulfate exporter family transporter [Balneolaceae bacterium]
MPPVIKKILFIAVALLCFTPWVQPPLALLLGIILAFTIGQVFDGKGVSKSTGWLLKTSVVGLGFGMNFFSAIEVGKTGLLITVISIASTFAIGYIIAKKLSVDSKISILISSGTAICGGSAIAAMSPIINANSKQISIALGAVFILNSVALFIFPLIGNLMDLSQTQFGYWAAIAIHDTSSVVGAAASYGSNALSIATTVKLGRALWILPITFLTSFLFKSENSKIKIPYFIGLFVVAMLLNTFVPAISAYSDWIVLLAKKGLTLTLFLIGSGLSVSVLKAVGFRPMIKAILLWIFIALSSLGMILFF